MSHSIQNFSLRHTLSQIFVPLEVPILNFNSRFIQQLLENIYIQSNRLIENEIDQAFFFCHENINLNPAKTFTLGYSIAKTYQRNTDDFIDLFCSEKTNFIVFDLFHRGYYLSKKESDINLNNFNSKLIINQLKNIDRYIEGVSTAVNNQDIVEFSAFIYQNRKGFFEASSPQNFQDFIKKSWNKIQLKHKNIVAKIANHMTNQQSFDYNPFLEINAYSKNEAINNIALSRWKSCLDPSYSVENLVYTIDQLSIWLDEQSTNSNNLNCVLTSNHVGFLLFIINFLTKNHPNLVISFEPQALNDDSLKVFVRSTSRLGSNNQQTLLINLDNLPFIQAYYCKLVKQ